MPYNDPDGRPNDLGAFDGPGQPGAYCPRFVAGGQTCVVDADCEDICSQESGVQLVPPAQLTTLDAANALATGSAANYPPWTEYVLRGWRWSLTGENWGQAYGLTFRDANGVDLSAGARGDEPSCEMVARPAYRRRGLRGARTTWAPMSARGGSSNAPSARPWTFARSQTRPTAPATRRGGTCSWRGGEGGKLYPFPATRWKVGCVLSEATVAFGGPNTQWLTEAADPGYAPEHCVVPAP